MAEQETPRPDGDGETTVTGLVDGFAGGLLTGWAIDPARDGPCAIAVLDDAGTVVAQGMADLPRTDLHGWPLARHDVAFRIAIADLGAATLLHVMADGAELAGSPLGVGAGVWDGVVAVIDGVAEGWVHERRAGGAAPWIVLHDQDGVCLGEGAAVAPDGGGFARFRIRLGEAAFGRAELALRASADGTAFATALADLSLASGLETLDGEEAIGWVCCPAAPSVRFAVQVWRDGAMVAHGIADQARDELRMAFPECWRVGFRLALPRLPLPDHVPHAVDVRVAGTGVTLYGGPMLTGARRSLIGPAWRAARLAHGSTGLDAPAQAVLQAAMAMYIAACRRGDAAVQPPRLTAPLSHQTSLRMTVVIPVYRDVEVTRACIDSVLAHRDPETDAVLLIDDASPDEAMAGMLAGYAGLANVQVLTNAENHGFVRSVNRALGFVRAGDVVLLNSDTVVFAGGLDELWRAAQSAPDIGTATAISNNATIFSYPFIEAGRDRLDDLDWAAAAAVCLAGNRGLVLDVPTGHGFCLLLRRAMLDRVGLFDAGYGRGYGEENDYCLRGLDLGFRSVAAPGAFVQHRENVSFGDDRAGLVAVNLPRLEAQYPEYTPAVRECLRRDDLRAGRWALDGYRLRQASEAGVRFALRLGNWLAGGTRKAMDQEDHAAGVTPLELEVDVDGRALLRCAAPELRAVFAPGEHARLFALLDGVAVISVAIHQLLGHGARFADALLAWSRGVPRSYHVHDFYPVCPRVTLIDAADEFCGIPPTEVCQRCVDTAGAHDADRMALPVAEHRAMFARLLHGMDRVIVPSANTAGYLARALPDLRVEVVPHAEPAAAFQVARPGSIGPDIVLFGAIGSHKGSGVLLRVAQAARLFAPGLRFHVIGYTDMDEDLLDCGNVTISGPYKPGELPGLIAASGAQLALFLHRCPETFSYTLSEAVQHGLIPLVPDLGAPADRVRAAGYGCVFPSPADPRGVLALIAGIIGGAIDPAPNGATPARFAR